MKSKTVRDALAPLDGTSYSCREDFEDAVFPYFSPLQEMFHGECHRDLVDRLIRARWLDVVDGKWKLLLPSLEKFPKQEEAPIAVAEPAFEQKTPEVNLAEFLATLANPGVQKLIAAGMLTLTPMGQRAKDAAENFKF